MKSSNTMSKSYKQLICEVTTENPSRALNERIMRKVSEIETRRFRIRVLAHSIISISAFIAFVPIISNFINNIIGSEFYHYASILSSDWSTLTSNWKTIMVSIIGTWPLSWTILLVASFIVFINSFRYLIINKSSLSNYKHAHP